MHSKSVWLSSAAPTSEVKRSPDLDAERRVIVRFVVVYRFPRRITVFSSLNVPISGSKMPPQGAASREVDVHRHHV